VTAGGSILTGMSWLSNRGGRRGRPTDRSCPQAEVVAISVFIESMKGRPS